MILFVRTNGELEPVIYEQREDGWYVKSYQDESFGLYADSTAGELDVRQLIKKDYDIRY